MLSVKIIDAINKAEAKAFATYGKRGINVIPVSVVSVGPESIILYNFFMGKTIENILSDNLVSLSCWSGLTGVQIKGVATYVTAGAVFEQAKVQMLEQFPTRVLKGLVTITPSEVYDISADITKAGNLLS
ncbi:hypothetical protein GW879_01075 [Candidatus Kaiserbacteria bacterium]|nr:hypothetical protein [Candidatus Kaiserbacteria bacterium]